MTHPTNSNRLVRAIGWTMFAATSIGHAQSTSPDVPMMRAAVEAPPPEPITEASLVKGSTAEKAASVFWEGKRLYDAGQFEPALVQFELAHRLVQDPTLLYDIAQCYRQLGDCSKAKLVYRQFCDSAPDSPLVTNAEEHLAALERTCPKEPSSRAAPAASTHSRPGAPSPAAGSRTQGAPRPPSDSRPALEPSSGTARRYWTWATLAAGLIAGGTATGIGIWNRERYLQWKVRDVSLAKGNAPGETDWQWAMRQQKNDELIDSIGHMDRVLATVGAASGVLLVGSALLFLTTPQSPSASPPSWSAKPRALAVRASVAPNDFCFTVLTAF